MHEKLLNAMLANECRMDALDGAPSLFVLESHCAGELWIVAQLKKLTSEDLRYDIIAWRWVDKRSFDNMKIWAEGYLGRKLGSK